MTRSDDLELILRPWLERNAPPAPDDLLPRVMREVDTMSQRTRTWPSFLATTPVGGWLAAAAVVTVLAAAIGLLVFGPNGSPVGGPNPTATPTVRTTPSPSPVPSFAPPASAQEAIDGNIAAWTAADALQAHLYYATSSYLRIANTSADFTENYEGLAAIATTIGDPGRTGCTISRTGAIFHQGSYWANPFRYACNGTRLDGFAIYHIGSDNRIAIQWAVVRSTSKPTDPAAAPQSVLTFLDAHDAATNREDYEALDATYAATADSRASIGNVTGRWTEIHSGIDAISEYHASGAAVDFRVARTGAVVQVGDLFAFPARYSEADGTQGDTIAVLRLNPDRTEILNEWVFGD